MIKLPPHPQLPSQITVSLFFSVRWWCCLKWISLKIFKHEQNPPRQQITPLSPHLTRWYSVSLKNKIAANSQTQRRKIKGKIRALFSIEFSLTTLWLILNNHTLWPSISDSFHYLVLANPAIRETTLVQSKCNSPTHYTQLI